MMFALLLLLLFIPHPAQPQVSRYDVVEMNHFFDQVGKPVFDQLIFWDFDRRGSRYLCEGYVIVRRFCRCRVSVVQHDRSYRVIRGRRTRETWTQYDPEVEARAVLPIELRRER